MDSINGAILLTGILAGVACLTTWLAKNYKKEYGIALSHLERTGKDKDASLTILGKLNNLYMNGKAAASDGVITPQEFERLGREGMAILESSEVKRLLGE